MTKARVTLLSERAFGASLSADSAFGERSCRGLTGGPDEATPAVRAFTC